MSWRYCLIYPGFTPAHVVPDLPPPTSTWTHSVIQLHLEMFVRKFYQLIIRLLVVSVPVLLCLYSDTEYK